MEEIVEEQVEESSKRFKHRTGLGVDVSIPGCMARLAANARELSPQYSTRRSTP